MVKDGDLWKSSDRWREEIKKSWVKMLIVGQRHNGLSLIKAVNVMMKWQITKWGWTLKFWGCNAKITRFIVGSAQMFCIILRLCTSTITWQTRINMQNRCRVIFTTVDNCGVHHQLGETSCEHYKLAALCHKLQKRLWQKFLENPEYNHKTMNTYLD